MHRFVESGDWQRHGDVTGALSADGNFPDLHLLPLWTFVGSVNAGYNRVSVENPSLAGGGPAYSQTRLALKPTDQLNLELKAGLRADARHHGWETDLLVQYATARVEAGGFEETKDTLRLRSAYKSMSLRSAAGDRWWAPIPFLEGQLETEFNRPAERAWHRLELTGIVGASLQLAAPLSLKVGFNLRQDVLAPGTSPTAGLNVGYRLLRLDLFSVLGKPLQLESELEYFYNFVGTDAVHELRHSDRLYFALLDRLFFTATFQAFLYHTGAVGRLGHNETLTVGLNFLWDAAHQSH